MFTLKKINHIENVIPYKKWIWNVELALHSYYNSPDCDFFVGDVAAGPGIDIGSDRGRGGNRNQTRVEILWEKTFALML